MTQPIPQPAPPPTAAPAPPSPPTPPAPAAAAAPAAPSTLIAATFRHASGPFWTASVLRSPTLTFRDRGRQSRSLVAVKNRARSDYRLKLWLEAEHPGGQFTINGEEVVLPHKKDGFHQGTTTLETLERILHPTNPARTLGGEPLPFDGETIDMCFETVFEPDPRAEYLDWKGNGADAPAWMGAITELRITPPQTGGGWHHLRFQFADGPGKDFVRQNQLYWWRINGVWCWVIPVSDGQGGTAFWEGLAPPPHFEVIRGWGADGVAPDMPDEPIVPRTRHALRRLYDRGVIDYPAYRAWMADVQTLTASVMGWSAAQGQLDFHQRTQARLAARLAQLNEWITKYYGRRTPAYKQHTLETWVEEAKTSDKDAMKVAGWLMDAKGITKGQEKTAGSVEYYTDLIKKVGQDYEEALGRCLDRESEHADDIETLYTPG